MTQKLKYLEITLANYALVVCACIFYIGDGLLLWSLYIVGQILLIHLNHTHSSKKSEYIFYSVNLVISTILANALSTYLYYRNIDSDPETRLVGEVGLYVGVIFVVVRSVYVFLKKRKFQ